MKFYIIGIDDNQEQYFNPEILRIIKSNRIFSGGKRHLEIVNNILPCEYTWIEIKVPLSNIFEEYNKHDEIVVFASGDPLFFGFANTIIRELPDAIIQLYPFFNSLQILAHQMLLPYQNMHIVSLTGRPWDKFDEALIMGYDMIGLLTDNKTHTPTEIATRMLQYGYDNYSMTVGELLGNKEKQNTSQWSLTDVIGKEFQFPNNIILQKETLKARPFGIPDQDFHLLNGRVKMITKMPIRLLSLSMLDLRYRKIFWDVGFCTGSVSIEAKLQFPHLRIFSFEQRIEGAELMENNTKKFGTPGIEIRIGDFTTTDIDNLPAPDAVFIGGHGGKMSAIVQKICSVLPASGVLVFNSVSEESKQLFMNAIQENNLHLDNSIAIKVDENNTIEVMKAIKI